jgi:hypothetical protein
MRPGSRIRFSTDTTELRWAGPSDVVTGWKVLEWLASGPDPVGDSPGNPYEEKCYDRGKR